VECAAHVGAMLRACGLSSEPLTADALARWLNAGKAARLTDVRFDLDAVGKDLLFEYDHPYTHGEDDVERDVDKTRRLLAAYPNAIVMRVRVDTVPLPPFDDPRAVVVEVKTQTTSLAMPSVAKALAAHVPVSYKARLEALTPRKKHAEIDAVVHALLLKIDAGYGGAVARLRPLLEGDEAAIVRLMRIHGLTQRYDNLVEFVRRVRAPPYNVTRVDTFLCDGLAARLDDVEGVFAVLDRLMGPEFGIKSLQTFVSGGVAAKFGDPEALYTILRTLKGPEFGIKSLQTFVCNGVAARFGDPDALYAILRTLKGPEFGIKSLQTFVSGGVAAKFGDPEALYTILRTLKGPEFGIKSLQTFMCNGVAAKFGDPEALFTILRTLKGPEFGIKSLQTFMCGGVAAKFDDPEALYTILHTLKGPEFGIKSLQTFVSGGVAAKFDDPEALYTILRTLKGPEFGIKAMQTFVSDSVAAKFDDPDKFFATLTRIYDALGRDTAIVVAGSGAFASRMYTPGFLEHVFTIATHLRRLQVDVRMALGLLLDKNNAKLMDAIGALETKLLSINDGASVLKYIQRFKYIQKDKGRPVYTAAVAALAGAAGCAQASTEEEEEEGEEDDVSDMEDEDD
jgi:hypothetical protein